MLITKTVNIEIKNANIKYYKNKGYTCKVGDIIEVKIFDVTKTNNNMIVLECDICHNKTKEIQLYNIYRNKDYEEGNYICFDCDPKYKCIICGSNYKSGTYKEDNNRYCGKHLHQMQRNNKILDRTKYTKNEIIKFDNHAEMILYNNHNEERARCVIDLEDIDKIKDKKWYLNNVNYVAAHSSMENCILLHRFLLDVDDKNIIVDHKDRNTLNNTKNNLRCCTKQENNCNKNKPNNNTSGFIGVSYYKSDGKWHSQIKCNYKNVNLGTYINKYDAIVARLKSEKELFGEFAPQRHLFEEYNIT